MTVRKSYLQFFVLLLAFSLFSGIFVSADGPQIETIRITPGEPPIAQNLSLETYMGIAVSGDLSAWDPDDAALTYSIVTGPRKGTVSLNREGAFLYTPGEKRRGRDTFSYTAEDAFGNISNVAEVTVRIRRQKTEVSYSDTAGTRAAYGAQYLAEQGLYTGELVGGVWLFQPERTMTRGAFLTLCMRLADRPVEESVSITGMTDDREIPQWLKPYVSAAVACQIPVMQEDAGTFSWEAPLTAEDAARILDGALNLTDVACESDDPAAQAAANVAACGILELTQPTASLTWGEAAEVLARAGKVLEARG